MEKKNRGTKKAVKLSKKKTTETSVKKTAKKTSSAKSKVKKKKTATKEIKSKKQTKAKKEVKKISERITAKKPSAEKPRPKKPEKKIEEKAKKVIPKKKTTKVKKETGGKHLRKIALPKKRVAKEKTGIMVVPEISITKPVNVKEMSPLFVTEGLPAEYGEDRITLMVVDPWKTFAYWEAKEDTISELEGSLVLRVYDVTGSVDVKGAKITFDIPVSERVGGGYIGIGPGRDFIVDIGVISQEGFIIIARSNRVTTPPVKVFKEDNVLPEEMVPVGYF